MGAIKRGREGQAYQVGILIRHEIFLLTRTTSSALGSTQLLFQSVTGALSPGIKQLGHTTGNSPPSSPEVRNAWHFTSTHIQGVSKSHYLS